MRRQFRVSGSDRRTLPDSFLPVTLTTPFRITIAITRLTRFIVRCKNIVVKEKDSGSDVEGTKPIFFDVDVDERKMKAALEHCHKHLGDNVTILYNLQLAHSIKKAVKEQGKYPARNFYGWESEKLEAVTYGDHLVEQISRAPTHLVAILAESASL